MTDEPTRRHRLAEERMSWRDIDGEVVVLDVDGSRYFSLNASGAMLWRQLAHGATTDELADALVQAHGIERARAHADASAFVSSLLERGLAV